jgi:hypothetical protein
VHPERHLRLFSVASEMALPDQHAQQETECEGVATRVRGIVHGGSDTVSPSSFL